MSSDQSDSAERDLERRLAMVNTPEGKARALEEIRKSGDAIYGTDPLKPGMIVETHSDGTVRYGHLINRRFVPA